MKKYLLAFLTFIVIISLTACGGVDEKSKETQKSEYVNVNAGVLNESDNANTVSKSNRPETVTVTSVNGQSEPVEVEVPYDPQRIVVLDLAALDIIDSLGLGDRVVGVADSSNVEYLKGYMEKENTVNVGTVKEVDFEAIMACEPDVIFMGVRMGDNYDALNEIAPVVRLITDSEIGVVESTRKNAMTIASIFGKEAEVDAFFAGFDERIAALKEVAAGKTAIVGMCTNGGFNILGNNGRCSIIGVEIGFENLGNGAANANSGGGSEGGNGGNSGGSGSPHGNEASFELIVALKPDYIFVMDRDAAIGTNGAKPAKEIMENELVMSTDAYKNGNLIILEHPAVWYVAEGGIKALSIMLSDLESALLK